MAGPLAAAALAAVDVDLQSGVTRMNPLASAARRSEARRPLFAETSSMEGGVFESALAAVDDDLQSGATGVNPLASAVCWSEA